MGILSTSWLIIWPQVINKILFVWGPMSSCVKSLRSKVGNKSSTLLYAFIFIFFVGMIFFLLFTSFLKNENLHLTHLFHATL